jgi:AraC-like DNA-binding protein
LKVGSTVPNTAPSQADFAKVVGAQRVLSGAIGRDLATVNQPCYSVQLLRPFALALRRYPGFEPVLLESLDKMDSDERLPIAAVHELLAGAIVLTGDPDLGLKAALEIRPGDCGATEYAARSAPTFGAAIEVVCRYMRLLDDTLDVRVSTEENVTHIVLERSVMLPRAAADYQCAAFYFLGKFSARAATAGPLDVWFTHAQPGRLHNYEQVFGPTTLHFGAAWNGFSFAASLLEAPLSGADPKLHAVMRRHAELSIARLPKAENLTERVRALIANKLAGGHPNVLAIARELRMSPRTLGRRLRGEGTTFNQLFEDLRRQLGLRYVGCQDLALSEIAFALGFSQPPAFHRAFKRWTGQTPLEYRRARRG